MFWRILKILIFLQRASAGKIWIQLMWLHSISFLFIFSYVVSVSRSPRSRNPAQNNSRTLVEIEDVCPVQDATCADDTNKVVKVIFSVESAKVGWGKSSKKIFFCHYSFYFDGFPNLVETWKIYLNIICQHKNRVGEDKKNFPHYVCLDWHSLYLHITPSVH